MDKLPEIFLSHRLDELVDVLAERLDHDDVPPLQSRILLVPNNWVKQWLLVELAKRKGIVMGIRCMAVEEGIFQNHSFPNYLEMFLLIYQALAESKDPDVLDYLRGQETMKQALAEQLTPLFFKYGKQGSSLFEPGKAIDWQHAILQKLFVEGPWRSPVQKMARKTSLPIHCFGIDFLPPAYWEALVEFRSLSVYLFSPCAEFWEDLCSDNERKNLKKFWKRRGATQSKLDSLDTALRDAPVLLANWGKIGRETLKTLGQFEFLMEEAYPSFERSTLLKQVQSDLLYFQNSQAKSERMVSKSDESIRISLTGSSRLREVEVLRDSILRLVKQSGLSFQDISVLAPHVDSYVPLIEFIFSEEGVSIPYRISGIDIRKKSSFSQGLLRLSALSSGRWEAEDLLSLFETPSFYRKQGWDSEKLERYRDWVSLAHIDWGADASSKEKSLKETFSLSSVSDLRGTWDKGCDALLDRIVFLFPNRLSAKTKNREVPADELEEFLDLFLRMKKSLSAFNQEKTLDSWASSLESLAEEFLETDPGDEADSAALQAFRQFLNDLRQAKIEARVFPFSAIRSMMIRPCSSQIHSSFLHAVRFASIEEGALIPSKAVFLIGMDETSFPRQNRFSSLDLLSQKNEQEPSRADQDRYLFLQALFSAREFLRISYCHLTPDEGKPIGPSLPVQELLSYVDSAFAGEEEEKISTLSTVSHPPLSFDARCFSDEKIRNFSKGDYLAAVAYYGSLYGPKRDLDFWPQLSRRPDASLPEGEFAIPIAHLRMLAQHPWKFYLQKIQGIFLSDSMHRDNPSLNMQKSQFLKSSLSRPIEEILAAAVEELPLGVFGEAVRMELFEKAEEWKGQLNEWGVRSHFSLCFLEQCRSRGEEKSGRLELPPIELRWENRLKVRIVGEIPFATEQGLLSTQEDQIGGLIKIWPEALTAAIALNAPQILMLKSGKIKRLDCPEESLKAFVEYYFLALQSPSPLLPEWADPILRKGAKDLEKKMETTFSGRGKFEDPIVDWVAARMQIPAAEEICLGWEGYLKGAFNGLIDLYPTRGKSNAAV